MNTQTLEILLGFVAFHKQIEQKYRLIVTFALLQPI